MCKSDLGECDGAGKTHYFVTCIRNSGAQVTVASFVVNFLTEEPGLSISQSKASTMFSLCQVTFTIGRFVGVVILNWVDPALLLTFHAVMYVPLEHKMLLLTMRDLLGALSQVFASRRWKGGPLSAFSTSFSSSNLFATLCVSSRFVFWVSLKPVPVHFHAWHQEPWCAYETRVWSYCHG